MKEFDPGNNAQQGEDCCDEVYEDDGRWTDGGDHGGDWGSHSHSDWITENVDVDYGEA